MFGDVAAVELWAAPTRCPPNPQPSLPREEMDLTKARRSWVQLYAQTKDAGLVCRRCGISRPTLRKWWRRYQADGDAGLSDRSRRPKRFAGQKERHHHQHD